MNHTIRKAVRKIIPSQHDVLKKLLRQELTNCKSLLDLGCGENSPLRLITGDQQFRDLYSVGVDVFSPYILENLGKNKIHSKYINGNIFEIDFPEKSFDCAVMLDVIEHFEKDDFLKFLPKLEKIAKKIIVLTPNGFFKQDSYDGNPFQEHLSGWTMDDLKQLGFQKFYGMSGLRGIVESRIKPEIFKTLLMNITQPFILNRPEHAFHLFAVKDNR